VPRFSFGEARGVAHAATTSSIRPRGPLLRSGLPLPSIAPSPARIVGHSDDEEALAAVARADFRRREQSRLKPITQVE
jgi:hypothetical protein